MLRLGLTIVAATLLFGTVVETVFAWAIVKGTHKWIYYVLISGDPPTFLGLVLIALSAKDERPRLATWASLTSFVAGFAVIAIEILRARKPALFVWTAFLSERAASHIGNAAEVLGFVAILWGWWPMWRERQAARRLHAAAALATAVRGVVGLVAIFMPSPAMGAAVALTSAVMFGTSAALCQMAGGLAGGLIERSRFCRPRRRS